jgi:integrase
MAKRKYALREDHNAWYLRVYIGGKQQSFRLGHRRDFISRDEVNRAADRKLEELARIMDKSTTRVDLNSFIEFWYFEADRWRPSTLAGYRKLWKRYLGGAWAKHPLWKYRTLDVQRFLDGITEEHDLSAATVKHIKAFLSGVFRYAVVCGIIRDSPVNAALIPRAARRSGEPYTYTLAEVESILAALKGEPFARAAFAVASFAGLRRAEIQGLSWEDLDFDERTISVNRTRWQTYESEPKSRASKSWVPMTARLEAILRDYRDNPPPLPKPNGRRSVTSYPPNAVFPISIADLPIGSALKRRGIIWHGFHAARRGLASNLFELGVDDLTVSRILRHQGVQVTRDHYIRRRDERMERAMGELEKSMEQGANEEREQSANHRFEQS